MQKPSMAAMVGLGVRSSCSANPWHDRFESLLQIAVEDLRKVGSRSEGTPARPGDGDDLDVVVLGGVADGLLQLA